MTIEQAVRDVLGLVALRRLPKDYPEGTGAMLDEMSRDLATRIERSWIAAINATADELLGEPDLDNRAAAMKAFLGPSQVKE